MEMHKHWLMSCGPPLGLSVTGCPPGWLHSTGDLRSFEMKGRPTPPVVSLLWPAELSLPPLFSSRASPLFPQEYVAVTLNLPACLLPPLTHCRSVSPTRVGSETYSATGDCGDRGVRQSHGLHHCQEFTCCNTGPGGGHTPGAGC